MKKVAILSNYRDSFELSNEKYSAYQELTYTFRNHGIDLRRVSLYSFDIKTGSFSDYVDMDASGKFQIFHETYRPDVIWNRSGDGQLYIYDLMKKAGIPLFPVSKVVAIDNDKYEMSLFLGKYQPTSLLLKNFLESEKNRVRLQDKIVLKPIRASSGHGIEFYTQQELLANEKKYFGLESLYIVQDFKDFSKGAPGLASGIHDVRLVYIGGKYSHGTLRTPAKGSLKSNVGSGGNERLLGMKEIPQEVYLLAESVLFDLDIGTESILSIDFGYVLDEDRWYLFEINFSPGIYLGSSDENECRAFYDAYFTDMVHLFQNRYFAE